MMYFMPSASKKDKTPPHFGFIVTAGKKPSGSSIVKIKQGWRWICDNGVFAGQFDEEVFYQFIERLAAYKDQCVFVVAPDVIGDSKKTLEQFEQYAARIKALGYPVAFVAQDGQEDLPFPENFDALFIGGSTEWKMSRKAEICIKRAQALGKWVHVGRVNTRRRIRHFALVKVDSVDGTTAVYGKKEKEKIKQWTHEAKQPLFYM